MKDYRQSIGTRNALLLATVLAVTTASPAIAADAQPTTLDLSGFEGEVQLVQGQKTQLLQPARGWKLVDQRGSLALVQAEEKAGGDPFSSVCGAPAQPAFTRPSGDRSGKGARVEIGIAPSTSVQARRFSGTLRSRVPLIEPDLEVHSGKVELAQISGGALAVRGPGSMAVVQAADKVDLAVEGAGSLHVKGGITAELSATLQGSGSIRHDGVVQRAILSASGDGTIRVHRVEDPLRVEQAGFASLSMDCAEAACVR